MGFCGLQRSGDRPVCACVCVIYIINEDICVFKIRQRTN